MTQQQILSLFLNGTDMPRMNETLAKTVFKRLWKPWLTVELGDMLLGQPNISKFELSPRYQHGKTYLDYDEKSHTVSDSDARNACQADASFLLNKQKVWVEVRCFHQAMLGNKVDISKIEKDYTRVDALNAALPDDRVLMLTGIFGKFTTKQLEAFNTLDNSTRCTYVLDSHGAGSTQISRLIQMQRGGEPRFLLAAY